MTKVYILQRDLPDCEKGAEYERSDDGENYVCYNNVGSWSVCYPSKYVENNPTFFLPKEEPKHIFKTEDGYDVDAENQLLYIVYRLPIEIGYSMIHRKRSMVDAKTNKYFLEEQNALAYIEDNKPLFSKKELREWADSNWVANSISVHYVLNSLGRLIDSKK